MKKKILGLLMAVGFMSSLGLVSGASSTADVTVNPYMDLTFNYNTVNFPNMGSDDLGTEVGMSSTVSETNVTVDTNANWKLEVTGDTNFSSGWAVDSLMVDVNKNSGSADWSSGQNLPSTSNTNELATGTVATTSEGDFTHFYDYGVSVPSDMIEGDYTADFTLTYSNTG